MVGETQTITTTENYTACTGTSYDYFGTSILAGSSEDVTFTSVAGCDSIVTVVISENPGISFSTNATPTCEATADGTVEIISQGGSGTYQYSLDGVEQMNNTFTGLMIGTYQVMITDGNGCTAEETIEIEAIERPSVELDEVFVLECGMDEIELTPAISGNVSGLTYEWSTGSINSSVAISTAGVVSLSVTDGCGSIMATTMVEKALDARTDFFYIPNAFSPNGDNNNDVFKVYPVNEINILSFEIQIMDRWGNLIFVGKEVDNGWNGFYKSQAINSGVFIYQLRATIETCGQTKRVERFGDVTLMR